MFHSISSFQILSSSSTLNPALKLRVSIILTQISPKVTIYMHKTVFPHLSFLSGLPHHHYCLHTPEILLKSIKSDFFILVFLQVKKDNVNKT